jgi:hypothetical protein
LRKYNVNPKKSDSIVGFNVNIRLVVVSRLLVNEIMFNFRKKVNILKDHARLQGADKTKYKMI